MPNVAAVAVLLAASVASAAEFQLTGYVAQFEATDSAKIELASTLDATDPFRERIEAGVRKVTARGQGFGGVFRLRRVGTYGFSDTGKGKPLAKVEPAAVVFVLFAAPLRDMEMPMPAPGDVFVYEVGELDFAREGPMVEKFGPELVGVGPETSFIERVEKRYVRLKVDPSKTIVRLSSSVALAAEWTGDLKPSEYVVLTGLMKTVFPPDVMKVRAKGPAKRPTR